MSAGSGAPPQDARKAKKTPVASPAEDFLKREFPPKEPLIEGLLSKRDLVTLGGRRREGKTTVSMNIAVALATPHSEFLGYGIPQGRRTLLVLLEDDGGEFQEKLKRIIGMRELGGRLRLLTRDDFHDANVRIDVSNPSFQQTIVDACRDHQPDLLVLDNLAHLIAAEYGDSTRIHELMQFCYVLAREHGPAVIICAHPRKEDPKHPVNLETKPTQFFESVMGSSHFVNSTGSLWGIQRKGDYSVFLGGQQRVDGHQAISYVTKDENDWLHLDDNFARNLDSVLNTPARKQAWELLPNSPEAFGYREGEQRVKPVMKSASTYYRWFTECIRVGVIVTNGDNKYCKGTAGSGRPAKSVEAVEAKEAA